MRYEYTVTQEGEEAEIMIYTHCAICGCTPKPDEWSIMAENCCFDCA